MKTMHDRCIGAPSSAARRKLLHAAVAGAGLSTLSASGTAAALALTAGGTAPSLMLGYCTPASMESKNPGTSLGEAYKVLPVRGTYELRVIGAGTREPMALSAQYSIAEHRFWQAWLEQRMLQRSPPIAIRWAATRGDALPINIRLASGTLTAEVTARAGVYVIAAVPSAQRVPAWSMLALKKQTTGGVESKLVSSQNGVEVTFPYAVFAVQPVASNVA